MRGEIKFNIICSGHNKESYDLLYFKIFHYSLYYPHVKIDILQISGKNHDTGDEILCENSCDHSLNAHARVGIMKLMANIGMKNSNEYSEEDKRSYKILTTIKMNNKDFDDQTCNEILELSKKYNDSWMCMIKGTELKGRNECLCKKYSGGMYFQCRTCRNMTKKGRCKICRRGKWNCDGGSCMKIPYFFSKYEYMLSHPSP